MNFRRLGRPPEFPTTLANALGAPLDAIGAIRWLAAAHSTMEYVSVAEGLRPAGAATIPTDSMPRYTRRLVELGLVSCPVAETAYREGFQHSLRSPRPGERHGVTLVFARDRGTLEEAMDAWGRNDHRALGELFGYPGCCIEAFAEDFERWIDPLPGYISRALATGAAVEAAENGDLPRLEMADCLPVSCIGRYLGIGLAFHIPCRPLCPDTLSIAAEVASLMWRRLRPPEPVVEFLGWQGTARVLLRHGAVEFTSDLFAFRAAAAFVHPPVEIRLRLSPLVIDLRP